MRLARFILVAWREAPVSMLSCQHRRFVSRTHTRDHPELPRVAVNPKAGVQVATFYEL